MYKNKENDKIEIKRNTEIKTIKLKNVSRCV